MRLIKVKIGGQIFEGDFLSPDEAEKYEAAISKAIEKAENGQENETGSQGIRRQCDAVCECADTILGEGSSKRLFPNGVDLLSCLDVFHELCNMHDEQVVPLIREKSLKYSAKRVKRES